MTRAESEKLSIYKITADALTLTRIPLALLVVALAAIFGRDALGVGLVLILLGWTTDVLDGRLARIDPRGTRTAIGDADLYVDLMLDTAGLLLFVFSGFVPAWIALIYLALAAGVIIFCNTRAVITYFELPVLAAHPLLAFVASPWVGLLYVIWLLGAAVFDRRRLFEIIGVLLGKEKEKDGEASE